MEQFLSRIARIPMSPRGLSLATAAILTMLVALVPGLFGCQRQLQRGEWLAKNENTNTELHTSRGVEADPTLARNKPIFRAREVRAGRRQMGSRVSWNDLRAAMDKADVIIIGEQHDDAAGHAVQQAIVEDVTSRWQGSRSALSMEMLERNDQWLADDLRDGLIDAKSFAKQTLSEKWAGEDSWQNWYQPIIDAALSHRARIIAANAPRHYVRLARTGGYRQLRSLPCDRRALFDLPVEADDAAYRKRFFQFMSGGAGHDAPATMPAETQPASEAEPKLEEFPQTEPAVEPVGTELLEPESMLRNQQTAAQSFASMEAWVAIRQGLLAAEAADQSETQQARVAATYRSQQIWDATMAASIARAHKEGARKVIHLVGQFHSDFDGGLVQQIKARLPRARLLVISMQPIDSAELRSEDYGRADFVIYTGTRPEPAIKPAQD